MNFGCQADVFQLPHHRQYLFVSGNCKDDTQMINESATVDEAISKGHRMVTYPVIFIMFSTFGLTYYLSTQNKNTVLIWLAGLILSFVFGWIYWSIVITKWRLWAFENVRNVHELKKRAIQEKLIWEDESMFEKTEIRSLRAKEKWTSLQSKFKQADIYHDDLTIPSETIIFYSRGKNYLEMIIMLACLGIGIYLLATTNDSNIFASILIIIGAYFGYKEFKEATNKKPQIIINNKELQTF